jgi:hypothetical protein
MKTTIEALTMMLYALACSNADQLATDSPAAGIAAKESPLLRAEQPLVAPAAGMSTDQICSLFMQRRRACSGTFIPALVEARVRADNPAGIAATDSRIGREALVEEAFAEWQNDSKDEAIASTCNAIAKAVQPARDAELRTSVSGCLAVSGCDEFVACGVPLNLRGWKE